MDAGLQIHVASADCKSEVYRVWRAALNAIIHLCNGRSDRVVY